MGAHVFRRDINLRYALSRHVAGAVRVRSRLDARERFSAAMGSDKGISTVGSSDSTYEVESIARQTNTKAR